MPGVYFLLEIGHRGQPFEFELRLRRHDGIFHWFLNRAQPVRDGQGQMIKRLGTAIDIDQKSPRR